MTHEEYLALIQTIERHNRLYYTDQPEITDAEYDALTQKLKAAEAEHPDWVTLDSPTQHVGAGPLKNNKTQHRFPLLSLNDLFSLDDVKSWYENLGCPNTVVEEKIDGLTAALTYIDGTLTLGATRGDGRIGEIVTEQIKQVHGIPHTLSLPAGVEPHNTIIIRAEVNQTVTAFEQANKRQESLGQKLFANPRNCAAGGLRANDPQITRERDLQAIAFQIIYADGWDAVRGENPTQSQDVEILKSLGFIPVTQYYCRNFQDILDAIHEIGQNRNILPYWTDGAVIKTDDLTLQAEIGATEKYPLHSVAYKYPAETKRTTIREIQVTVGRTGVLVPVAVFDPVYLSGTSVSRATLHNQKFINDKKLNVGAEIEVLKSGEIIPKVVGVPTPAKYPFKITHCPICGTRAVLAADENGNSDTEVMVCPNITGCPAQKLRYFEFFCSRDVMDIRGMGRSVIATLIDAGLLNEIHDIYYLKDHMDEMTQLPGIGTRKAKALLLAIEESKDNDIDRVIKALGIPGVGRHVGKALAARYETIDDAFMASKSQLTNIEGIGDITAEAIWNFWEDPACRERYNQLKAAGVNTHSLAFLQAPKGNILSGLTFVITGTLPSMSRDEAKNLIESNGGKVSESVSKKTSYVLAGEKAGSKLDKANNLGVPVIDLDTFKSMLL